MPIDLRERDIDQYLPPHPNMHLNWKWNRKPFGVQEEAPTNWATWPG